MFLARGQTRPWPHPVLTKVDFEENKELAFKKAGSIRQVICMKKDRKVTLLNIFILASLFIHFSLMISLYWAPRSAFVTDENRNVVEFEVLEKTPQDSILPAQQIVDQAERQTNEPENKNAKYLSAQNQTVLKETAAQKKGEFKNAQKLGSQGSAQNPAEQSQDQAKNKNDMKADPKGSLEKDLDQNRPREKDAIFRDLTKKYNSKNMFENAEKRTLSQTSPGAPGEASQTSDYLKGKDQGLETLLNTREYKYYTYFNRIRRKLSEHWEPKVKQKMNKMFQQGRTIASTEDKITKLLIVLNDNGVLVKVQVLHDSGVHDLDEAAIEAFRAAAPFPHPPDGIIDEEGTIKIRWDFILES